MRRLKKLLPKKFRNENVEIPVVRLHGAIMSGGNQFNKNLNLASVAELLDRAFADKKAPAVAFSVNSPGGSPVQSRQIHNRIRQLAEEKERNVWIAHESELVAEPAEPIGRERSQHHCEGRSRQRGDGGIGEAFDEFFAHSAFLPHQARRLDR